jgi:hypothetical protein
VAQHALKVFRVFHAGVLESEEWGVRMFPMVPYDFLFAFLTLFLIALYIIPYLCPKLYSCKVIARPKGESTMYQLLECLKFEHMFLC